VYEYIIDICDSKIRCTFNDLDTMLHVLNYLELLGNDSTVDCRDNWQVIALLEEKNYDELMKLFDNATELELEYGDKGKIVYVKEKKLILNCRTGTILMCENKKVTLYCNQRQGLFVDTYKTIRQIIAYQLLLKGAIPIHSSSFSLGGQGILFIGNKKAGKTTLSVKSVMKYGRLCEYLGNDRMFLLEKEGEVYIYSLPTVIGIGCGMIKNDKLFKTKLKNKVHKQAGGSAFYLLDQPLIPETLALFDKLPEMSEDDLWEYDDKKLWITPGELAVISNCKCGWKARLKYVVLPKINNICDCTISNDADVREVFIDNILDIKNLYPNWLGFEESEICLASINEMISKIGTQAKIIQVSGNVDKIIELLDVVYHKTEMS